MNRTTVFVTFVALVSLAIIGTVILLIFKTESFAAYSGFIINILGMVTLAAGTFAALGKTNEKVTKIEKQTNGTLSRLMNKEEENTETIRILTEQKAALEAALKHPSKKVKEL